MARKVYTIRFSKELDKHLLENDNGNYGNVWSELISCDVEGTNKANVQKCVKWLAEELKKFMELDLEVDYIVSQLRVEQDKDQAYCSKCDSVYWADDRCNC